MGHSKTRRALATAGAEALVYWLALKAYCAANPTDGFVPYEVLDDLLTGLIPPKRRAKARQALIECGAVGRDGIRGPGLVHELEFGLQLHDYGDHAMDAVEIEERRRTDRARKELQRSRLRLKRALEDLGMHSEAAEVFRMSHDAVTARLEDMSRDMSRDTMRDVPRIAPVTVTPPRARAPTHAGTRDPNPAQPNPAQPNPLVDPPTWSKSNLSSLEAALRVPIRDRCRLGVSAEFDAQWASPHEWPELVAFHAAARSAMGLCEAPLGPVGRDSTTRALMQLFATFEPAQLDLALANIPRDPYAKKLRDVGGLTPRVVRTLLEVRGTGVGRQPDIGERYEFDVEVAAS